MAGAFVAAGFFAGRVDDVLPATDANPAGYHENLGLVIRNDEILTRLGGTWFDPPSAESLRSAASWASPQLSAELDRIVEQSGGAPVVIKDPRIGVMLELWGPIIEPRLHPVLAVRDPLEVAASLARRDGTPWAVALAGWEAHTAGLLRHLHERLVTVTPYRALVEDRALAGEIVAAAAGHLDPSLIDHVRPANARGSVAAEFYRQRASGDRELSRSQRELWALQSSWPPGDRVIDASIVLGASTSIAR